MAMAPGTTLGVEEEFLLLDRRTAQPAPRVSQLQTAADHEPGLQREEVDSELLQAQHRVRRVGHRRPGPTSPGNPSTTSWTTTWPPMSAVT